MAFITLNFTSRKEIFMAVSEAFAAQVARIDAVVAAAVAKQASADADAIAAAQASADAEKAALAQANQDLTDELAALQAKLDAFSA